MEKEKINCRIFRDPETNKLIDSYQEITIGPGLHNIMETLGEYHPKHGRQYKDMDSFSIMILDIKKDVSKLKPQSKAYRYYKTAIEYFTDQLRSILSEREEFVICVMPTHVVGRAPSGIREIAKRLCHPPIIDGTDVLTRAFEIPQKARGGSRDLGKEIESLAISNKDIIKDRQVLLLDDVTTSGTSLMAGRYKLKNAGAKIVAMFALGQTTY